MRILYLGTAEIGLNVFQTLIDKFDVVGLLTQPDKPVKRSKDMIPSPVAVLAAKYQIKTFKAEKISEELIEELLKLKPDIFVTFAYGVILPKKFFDITPLGGINIHPSLLPDLRGPSPIQTAILKGKQKSGVTIQKIALKVDSGDIILQNDFDITEKDDSISIENKVIELSGKMIVEVIQNFENKKIVSYKQDESIATYCKMIKKEDGLIDWNVSGYEIFNKIRAFNKWPVAHTYLEGKQINLYKSSVIKTMNISDFLNNKNGEIVKADIKSGLFVKTKDCILSVEMLQSEGKKILDYKNFLNGQKTLKNKVFSIAR